MNPFSVHTPTFSAKHRVDLAVAVSRVFVGQRRHALHQACFLFCWLGLVTLRGSGLAKSATGQAFADRNQLSHCADRFFSPSRAEEIIEEGRSENMHFGRAGIDLFSQAVNLLIPLQLLFYLIACHFAESLFPAVIGGTTDIQGLANAADGRAVIAQAACRF